MKFKLPNQVYIIAPEAAAFLRVMSRAARINGADGLADDLNFLAQSWFYDSIKLIEDVPEAQSFIGNYLVIAEAPSAEIMKAFKESEFTSENGNVIKGLEFDA